MRSSRLPALRKHQLRRSLGTKTFDFASTSYWDGFYERKHGAQGARSEAFEWFSAVHTRQPAVWEWLLRCVQTEQRLLHIGCGTSELGVALSAELRVPVDNVDSSAAAIEHMQSRFGAAEGCRFAQMDALELQYADCTFGTVVDKGTFDVFGFTPAPTPPSATAASPQPPPRERQACMLRECDRVLANGGRLIQITADPPEQRLDTVLATLTGWQRSFVCFGGGSEVEDSVDDDSCGFTYYAYCFEKPRKDVEFKSD